MGREDHQRVVEEMRLANGYIFPVPVTLPVEAVLRLELDQEVTLRSTTTSQITTHR